MIPWQGGTGWVLGEKLTFGGVHNRRMRKKQLRTTRYQLIGALKLKSAPYPWQKVDHALRSMHDIEVASLPMDVMWLSPEGDVGWVGWKTWEYLPLNYANRLRNH